MTTQYIQKALLYCEDCGEGELTSRLSDHKKGTLEYYCRFCGDYWEEKVHED